MKYIWEESDVVPGQRYKVDDAEEIFIIGYMAARDDKKLVSISLSDGMVQPEATAADWAATLNSSRCVPVGGCLARKRQGKND